MQFVKWGSDLTSASATIKKGLLANQMHSIYLINQLDAD
jgi:hypothetical protein